MHPYRFPWTSLGASHQISFSHYYGYWVFLNRCWLIVSRFLNIIYYQRSQTSFFKCAYGFRAIFPGHLQKFKMEKQYQRITPLLTLTSMSSYFAKLIPVVIPSNISLSSVVGSGGTYISRGFCSSPSPAIWNKHKHNTLMCKICHLQLILWAQINFSKEIRQNTLRKNDF